MSYTEQDFIRDIAFDTIGYLTVEERLKGLRPEERLQGLGPEERLQGLRPEERLQGLGQEEIEQIKTYLASFISGQK